MNFEGNNLNRKWEDIVKEEFQKIISKNNIYDFLL